MTDLINDDGGCRTAPATPGLLIKIHYNQSIQLGKCKLKVWAFLLQKGSHGLFIRLSIVDSSKARLLKNITQNTNSSSWSLSLMPLSDCYSSRF